MASQEKLKKRFDVYNYFRKVAAEENQKKRKVSLQDLLDKDDEGRRLCIVMPKSVGDVYMISSLLPNIHKTYPDYNVYFATEVGNFELLDGNPYIHKLLPYNEQMDNLLAMEGQGNWKGFFEICFLPAIGTQKILNYLHHGDKDIVQFDIDSFAK